MPTYTEQPTLCDKHSSSYIHGEEEWALPQTHALPATYMVPAVKPVDVMALNLAHHIHTVCLLLCCVMSTTLCFYHAETEPSTAPSR